MSKNSLRELVESHYDRIFRAARFMCGDASAAEDLAQETFLAAGESLGRFRGRSSPYTWLYGILLNKFRRWLRGRKRSALSLQAMAEGSRGRQGSEVLQTDAPGPPENAERRETADLVREAVQGLTTDHRSVITLRFVEGMSYNEIAEALDCPVGTVKSRIHYALLKIEDGLGSAAPSMGGSDGA